MIQKTLSKIRADSGLSTLLKNSGLLYVAGLVSLALTFAQQISTARLLGVEDYGRLAVVLGAGLLVMLVVDFRTMDVALKFMARPIAERHHAETVRVMSWLVTVEITTGLFSTLAMILLAPPIALYLLHAPELDTLVRLYALGLPFRILAVGVVGGLPRLYDRFDWVALKSVIYSLIRLVLMTGAALLGFGLTGVVIGAVLGEILNAAILVLMAWLLRREHLHNVPLFDLTSPSEKRALFTVMRDLWVSGTLTGLHGYTFVPLVALLTTPAQVGLFRAGLDLAEALERTVQPLTVVFSPRIIALHEQGLMSEFRRYLKQVAVLMVAITSTLTLAICLIVPFTLPLLLPDYEGIVPVTLVLIATTGIFTALHWWIRPAAVALNLLGRLNLVMFILIIISFAALGLVVPSLGAIGGAWAKGFFLVGYALIALFLLRLDLQNS